MAVRDDFAAGEVLAAADLNDTFASKVDYATPTNAQAGTAYTFVADDAERITTASNGSAVMFTIPPQSSVTWGDDTILRVVNYGAGAVTVDGGSGVTVTNTATTVAQYQAAAAIRTGSDAWTLVPFAGGGEIPAAEISSPAATGQYTDGSGDTWDYYTFTSSGSLTVDTAGFADVLVIGGGGGGAYTSVSRGAGGGGAGGYSLITNAYLSATTHTITVGAGGAGASDDYDGNAGFGSQCGSYVALGGGGGGNAYTATRDGVYGGSGGGAGASGGGAGTGGAGQLSQGNNGGNGFQSASSDAAGGGGGGAGGAGVNGTSGQGGNGGAGSASSITGSSVGRAGGGSGASGGNTYGTATDGGGSGAAGTANTGGGGSGRANATAYNGGSGVVIVRVKV